MQIVERVRSKAGSGRRLTVGDWRTMDWNVHMGVDLVRPADSSSTLASTRLESMAEGRASDKWTSLSGIFVGGSSYCGEVRVGATALPRDFALYFATLHDDRFLTEASKRWAANWNLEVRIATPGELQTMLDGAYAAKLEAHAWLDRIHPLQRAAFD